MKIKQKKPKKKKSHNKNKAFLQVSLVNFPINPKKKQKINNKLKKNNKNNKIVWNPTLKKTKKWKAVNLNFKREINKFSQKCKCLK